jgi:hypothetical protein
MEALGHNSQAIHRAYAKRAKVLLPALEDYVPSPEQNTIIPMPLRGEQTAAEIQ